MKWLLVILLFVSFSSSAQVFYTGATTQATIQKGGYGADILMLVPNDTNIAVFPTARKNGRIAVKNGKLYSYDTTQNKWVAPTGGGGTTYSPGSCILIRNDSILVDSSCFATAFQRYRDSLLFSNQIIDSATAIRLFVNSLISNYYTKTESDARYLQSFTELDPVFKADSLSLKHKRDSVNDDGYLPINRWTKNNIVVTEAIDTKYNKADTGVFKNKGDTTNPDGYLPVNRHTKSVATQTDTNTTHRIAIDSKVPIGSNDYIKNQTASPQTADYNITGTGTQAKGVFNDTTGPNTGTVLISRTISPGTGTARAYRDITTFKRQQSSYISYDARGIMGGGTAGLYGTLIGFNTFSVFTGASNTDTLDVIFNFNAASSVTKGVLKKRYGFRVGSIDTGGITLEQYGLFVDSFRNAVTNYGVYVDGISRSYFGGSVILHTVNTYSSGGFAGYVGKNATSGELETKPITTSDVSGISSYFLTAKYAPNKVLTGTVNGVNTVYTLPTTPVTGTVEVMANGVVQTSGYSITSGTTVTFSWAPPTGYILTAKYLEQ